MRIHRRPAHIGREEHPVGSLAGCPGCQEHVARLTRSSTTDRPNTRELALWLALIAIAIVATAIVATT